MTKVKDRIVKLYRTYRNESRQLKTTQSNNTAKRETEITSQSAAIEKVG